MARKFSIATTTSPTHEKNADAADDALRDEQREALRKNHAIIH
jgi:hypothetical protein